MSWFHRNHHADLIRELSKKDSNITVKRIRSRANVISLLFIRQLTDTASLSENVVKPMVSYCAATRKALKPQAAIESVMFADDCSIHSNDNKIESYILNGMTVMLFSNARDYVVVNLKNVSHRAVPEPELQYNVRSPKDCFTENMETNLSLLRYRLKDRNLRIENLETGRRSKTRIALAYIGDIARGDLIQELKKRIDAIDTDSIIDSGELQAFLSNDRLSLFPEMFSIERSDWAAELLMEGKAVILVDGSPLALSAPVTFVELMYTCDDRYENKFFGAFSRLIRYAAFFLSFSASSYWVAIIDFHSDTLPAGFIISLAQARSKVPFSALIGVLLLEFIMELIRESLLRVPNKIGSAIAIVSAIIIGQAAISAGVFSALLLIVIAMEFLASFAIPSQFASNTMRVIKLPLLIITSMFGFYGYILGITVVVAEMVSINSFGVPYLAPFGPFNLYDFLRSFMYSRTISSKRQQYMRNKDGTRTGQKPNPKQQKPAGKGRRVK